MPENSNGKFLSAIPIVLLAIAIIVAVVYLMTTNTPTTTVQILPPVATATASITPTPEPLQVYIIGAVQTPNIVVVVSPGARVNDVLQAAGGALDDANLSRVNLADTVQDGQMIEIPFNVPDGEVLSTPLPLPTSPSSSTPGDLININTATLETLDTLPGIGPALAQRIIDYRDVNGPFTSIEDLVNVSGIGDATLSELRPLITVN